ncbi:MAG: hypothetical protein JWP01_3700 [Myxococcales bacterium]|nr:hypothetical protein [Myxococcales bacterium]
MSRRNWRNWGQTPFPGRLLSTLALASLVATLAGQPAWGHVFPAVRNVVVQVEPCEVVLLVGYRPGTGEATDAILSRAASAPKSHGLDALRDVLAAYAMAPLTVTVDGTPVVPTSVRAKIGVEPGGARPMVVVLVTYPLAAAKTLAVGTKEPRSTRISWQDQRSDRVVIAEAPAQGKWHAGVASFLLTLSGPSGGPACATSNSSRRSLPSVSSPAR